MSVPQYNRSEKRANFSDLTGGYDSRHTPLVVEAESKSKLKAVTAQNVDFFRTGAVQKRLGKTQQGNAISVSAWASQTTANSNGTLALSGVGVPAPALAGSFSGGSSVSIGSVILKLATTNLPIQTTLAIYTDSAGSPGTQVGSGAATQTISNTSIQDITYTFSSPVAVTSGVTYWFVLAMPTVPSTSLTYGAKAGTSVKTCPDFGTPVWSSASKDLYFYAYASTASLAITGVYDYRHGYDQTREHLVTCNGNLYKRDKSSGAFTSTWTSLASTLEVGQDNLSSFATLKDYAFCTDGADAPSVVWDGSSTGAMRHGYRLSAPYVGNYTGLNIASWSGNTATMAAAQSASGIYVGKVVYLVGGAIDPQTATVKSYVTGGNPGTGASYTLTSVTFEEQDLQTSGVTGANSLRFNGCTVATGTGGSSAITSGTTVTTLSLLAVTSLKSGGYRASEFSIDVPTAGGPYKIALSNIAMGSSTDGTQFAFDVAERATTWFISPLFDPGATTSSRTGTAPTITYYKVPASTTNIQTGLNPQVNSTTAIDFYTAAVTTQNTLLDEYGYPQEYFTAQIDAPKALYLCVFQGYLVAAGDPSNRNRFWTSQADAPQIYSAAGGSYGSYYDLDANDGDVITGIAAWNTSLYIFKRHSVYYAEYTGLADAPFSIRRLQGALGALSGWAVKALDWGVVFLSERGPAFVSGTAVALLPGADAIQNLFDPNDSGRFNLGVMQYSTAGHNSTKQQVWWGVASTNATNRDQILVYDYANRAFSINTDSSNYLTEVGDAYGFQKVWSGNYNGEVFEQESGTTDDGTNIPFLWESPWITFTGGSDKKHIDRLWVRGDVQTSASTLSVDIYKDFGTSSSRTLTFDMTDSRFKAGMQVPVNLEAKAFKVRFSNTTDVPLKIDSFELDYQLRGMRV